MLTDMVTNNMPLAARLQDIVAKIADAASRSGRRAADVTLVAVSKRKPAEAIVEAHRAGCLHFGENYVQELADKAQLLADDPPRWHFIGHLQRNKAKALLAVPQLVLLHGVDNARLVAALDKQASVHARIIDVLVQVNVSGEASKSGCSPDALAELLDRVDAADAVRLRGLMTMPPPDQPDGGRRFFAELARLRSVHGGTKRLPELSMGMSQDFEVAIEEGATLVRVGSAIFGART
jgi:PLP dependent protein